MYLATSAPEKWGQNVVMRNEDEANKKLGGITQQYRVYWQLHYSYQSTCKVPNGYVMYTMAVVIAAPLTI